MLSAYHAYGFYNIKSMLSGIEIDDELCQNHINKFGGYCFEKDTRMDMYRVDNSSFCAVKLGFCAKNKCLDSCNYVCYILSYAYDDKENAQ